MKKLKTYLGFLLLIMLQSCSTADKTPESKKTQDLLMGSDQLIRENLDLIRNKRLGIIANKASVLSDGVLIIDTLLNIDGINIQAVFSPEHGFSINTIAGEEVSDSARDGIPIYSLYGKTRKPTPEMLKNIDLLVFDLQDVGTRFYTYISTLHYVMEAAAENNIPLVVLDRPNPIGGQVEGPVLLEEQKSFIGIAPLPVVHGMTAGEIAGLFSGEHWIGEKNISLKIIKMKNWERSRYFNDYNLNWISPSPNIPDVKTAVVYPAAGFLEGTNISDGRGTKMPFKQIGAPFILPQELIRLLDSLQHKGLSINPVTFTPVNIPGMADNPKYINEKCNGINLIVTSEKDFQPVEFGIKLLFSLYKLYPEKFNFDAGYFDNLTGDKEIREMLLMHKMPSEIEQYWQPGLNKFKQIRNKYLLY
ncbi:MAG TPA: DUF1343 domain-containing protein [Ignavibacteriaceae bacterium]|nr:DUF1343 domain-containing protein [Ignavibacteriaceae bacterium]